MFEIKTCISFFFYLFYSYGGGNWNIIMFSLILFGLHMNTHLDNDDIGMLVILSSG